VWLSLFTLSIEAFWSKVVGGLAMLAIAGCGLFTWWHLRKLVSATRRVVQAAQSQARIAASGGASASSRPQGLFLCTGNSCRSQMAEGFARALLSDQLDAFSAGTEPKPRDPRAVRVMWEVDVDISGQRPRHVDILVDYSFDCVITVCDSASQTC